MEFVVLNSFIDNEGARGKNKIGVIIFLYIVILNFVILIFLINVFEVKLFLFLEEEEEREIIVFENENVVLEKKFDLVGEVIVEIDKENKD